VFGIYSAEVAVKWIREFCGCLCVWCWWQDLSKAFKFFSMAAEQGWVDGQLQLGIMYYSTSSAVFE